MKIGILTYHRAHNYGAILQAIATRVALQSMGHEVFYVDYWPNYHRDMYKIFSYKKFMKLGIGGKLKYLILIITKYKLFKSRINSFQQSISEHIAPYCKPIDYPYDVVVIGSDQLWRKQAALSDYNSFYFGQNDINTKRQITYAVSMGLMPDNKKEMMRIKELLGNVDSISVRETDLAQLVNDLGYNCEVNIDPTFLLSQKKWETIIPSFTSTEKYVLYYNFQVGAFIDEEVYRFAESKRLKVKIITGGILYKNRKGDVMYSASVNDFISLIKNAEYVFTSSFHGLAFSIIFNKQFYASYSRNSNRARTLLETLGLQNHLIQKQVKIMDLPVIDYSEVNSLISNMRSKSLNYLTNNLR